MTTIVISSEALRAISLFSATKDIRGYLNGVCVIATNAETRLVATDGRALAVHRTEIAPDGGQTIGAYERVEVIIPLDVVKRYAKAKGDLLLKLVEPENAGDAFRTASIESGGEHLTFTLIDGKFPDYAAIIPHQCSDEVAQFDPAYLSLFAKARLAFGHRDGVAHVHHNGNGAALVSIGEDNFCGVVMPFNTRWGFAADKRPGWLDSHVAQPESEAIAA